MYWIHRQLMITFKWKLSVEVDQSKLSEIRYTFLYVVFFSSRQDRSCAWIAIAPHCIASPLSFFTVFLFNNGEIIIIYDRSKQSAHIGSGSCIILAIYSARERRLRRLHTHRHGESEKVKKKGRKTCCCLISFSFCCCTLQFCWNSFISLFSPFLCAALFGRAVDGISSAWLWCNCASRVKEFIYFAEKIYWPSVHEHWGSEWASCQPVCMLLD